MLICRRIEMRSTRSEIRWRTHVRRALTREPWPASLDPRALTREPWPASLDPRALTREPWPASLDPRALTREPWPTNFWRTTDKSPRETRPASERAPTLADYHVGDARGHQGSGNVEVHQHNVRHATRRTARRNLPHRRFGEERHGRRSCQVHCRHP